jgi:hypothetical protein
LRAEINELRHGIESTKNSSEPDQTKKILKMGCETCQKMTVAPLVLITGCVGAVNILKPDASSEEEHRETGGGRAEGAVSDL